MKGYCQKDRKPQGVCAESPLNIYIVFTKRNNSMKTVKTILTSNNIKTLPTEPNAFDADIMASLLNHLQPQWWCHLRSPKIHSCYLITSTQLTTCGHHCRWLHIRCDISFYLCLNFLWPFLSHSPRQGSDQLWSVYLYYCKLQCAYTRPPPSFPVIYGFPCKVHAGRIYHDGALKSNFLVVSPFLINSTSLGLRKCTT